ncbi:MAG: hypothetical protein EBS19_08975 [Spirochaetia bacterium]|nr:hypothetical protein [Spirochaetia bacterium]
MKNLILTLNRANLTQSDIETVLTEFDIWVDSKVERSEQKIMSQFIVPIQKETEGIRGELRMLAETMKTGYEKLDQKIDFTRKSLELQIASIRENLELQINSNREILEKQINSNRESLEKQINSNRESLEKQINSNRESLWTSPFFSDRFLSCFFVVQFSIFLWTFIS